MEAKMPSRLMVSITLSKRDEIKLVLDAARAARLRPATLARRALFGRAELILAAAAISKGVS